MIRKVISLILLIFINTTLSGCWDSHEPDDCAIVTALGIDKDTLGYIVSVQVLNPGQVSGKRRGSEPPVTTYIEKGSDILEVFRKLSTECSKKLFFKHMRILVFGETMAKEGVSPTLDLLTRSNEFRTDFALLVAKNTSAQKVLVSLAPAGMVPAESLFDSLTLSEKVLAQTKLMTIDEFIRVLVSQSKAPVVTGVEVLGHSAESGNDKQKNAVTTATLKLANLGVFRNDKLVGWLDDNDSKGYNYITGNVKNTVNSLPLSTGQIVEIKIVKSKVKLATSLENQQPVINVSLTIEGTIAGITADMDLSKEENIRLIEVEEGKEIEKLLTETVATAETVYVTDFLGFGDFIHRSDPKIWALLKDDWDNTFTHLPVNIAVQVKITGIGTKGKPILKDIKE